ncbi:MAG: helix-turn-helix domain-containing protein [Pseudomonadales bacterium]|nr:helix-turn-helix domain-containing protein [Pseudomonadales bacterium]
MIRVALLVLNNGLVSTVTGPLEILMGAGTAYNHLTGKPVKPIFKVKLVSIDGKSVRGLSGFEFNVQDAINNTHEFDLILITSGGDNIPTLLKEHKQAIPWLRKQYEQGATLASICSGSALLAATGLLCGKQATTHWGLVQTFRLHFPDVRLTPEHLIVEEDRLITSGGASACNDLSLYLIEKYYDKKTAVDCANAFLLDTGRQSQTQFSALLHQRAHNDPVIAETQEIMESDYASILNLDSLAAKICMSPRNFKRRFKNATGEQPLNYLQKVRIEAAKNLISDTRKNIEEVSLAVGYTDATHFRMLFKRYAGLSPTQYRAKFRT